MFGRGKRNQAAPAAPAPVEVFEPQEPVEVENVVGQAREIVVEVLDRLAEQVRKHTIADVVLVLEDLVAELEAYDASHPDDAYGTEYVNGVLDAICKVRLS